MKTQEELDQINLDIAIRLKHAYKTLIQGSINNCFIEDNTTSEIYKEYSDFVIAVAASLSTLDWEKFEKA